MNNPTFNDVYSDVDVFMDDWNNIGFYMSDGMVAQSDTFINKLYYLLLAHYYGHRIAYIDTMPFRLGMMKTLALGLTKIKRGYDVVSQINTLDLDEITLAGKQIVNDARNPNSASATEELPFIDGQNVNIQRFPKLMALQQQFAGVDYGFVNDFVKEFNEHFQWLYLFGEEEVYM